MLTQNHDTAQPYCAHVGIVFPKYVNFTQWEKLQQNLHSSYNGFYAEYT